MSPASPQEFWGPPSNETSAYSDEAKSEKPFIDSLIESESEGPTMCLNELIDNNTFDTPPFNFEEDIIKFSKVAESKQKKIIECYEKKKPLPSIDEDEFDYCTRTETNENVLTDDAAAFARVLYSSQDPANMVIYPITALTTSALGATDTCNINYDHSYVEKQSSIKEDSNVVEDHQHNSNNNIKETPKVPALKLKIMRMPSNIFGESIVGTPEILDQTLDMEKDFDLVSFITNPEVKEPISKLPDIKLTFIHLQNKTTFEIVTGETVKEEPIDDITPVVIVPPTTPTTSTHDESIRPKRKSTIAIDQLADYISAPKRRYSTRASSPATSTLSDYINPSSVQSNASSDDSYRPRRRGRPAKPVASLLDLNEFAHLSPEDLRYRELRNKNNEASRRSRMNRRSKEQQLEDEANELTQQYSFLEMEATKLERQCKRWRETVKHLALL